MTEKTQYYFMIFELNQTETKSLTKIRCKRLKRHSEVWGPGAGDKKQPRFITLHQLNNFTVVNISY